MLRVARFLNSFLRYPGGPATEAEISLPAETGAFPASLVRPPGDAPLPPWIVLHGVTVPGRQHPVLTRFAHALASSGALVVIPEIPEWRRLELDPGAGQKAIAATVEHLLTRDDVIGPINLVGFSFGATTGLMTAARPAIRPAVRGLVAFGGYCDLGRTFHCMMTGEHDWNGVQHRLDPDPYGRWVVVGNYLTEVPEFAHMGELQAAARKLAIESGTRGVYAAEAAYDGVKLQLRESLPPEQQQIWDLIAPPAGVRPPLDEASDLARRLLAAAYRKFPQLDPRPALPHLDQRIVLAHGFDDRLIPFTETLRIREALPATADVSLSITRLFAHSREAERLGVLAYPREVARYIALLRRALSPC